ncbi:MAG: oligosaccharide flippase family protein [Bacteroidia bacterium]|nr:oligosaccharide flippase family protein [Bacteroidia bacterium]
MSALRKLLSQTAVYGLSTIVGRLLNYLLVPLYTYQFSNTADYGMVGEFYAYVSFLNILLTYGMETALFNFSRQADLREKTYSTALLSLTFTSFLVLLPALFLSRDIAAWLGYPGKGELVSAVVVILVTDALCAIPFAKLREQNRAARFAFLKTFNILINIAINVFFLWFCKNRHAAGLSWGEYYNPDIGIGYVFIANAAANLVTLALLLPSYLNVQLRIDFVLWKRMMGYALPLVLVGLAGMVNETLDRVLIKYLVKTGDAMEQVGIYNACYKIAILMTIFTQAFRFAAEPFFFSHEKEKDSRKTYAVVMTWFVIVCAILFLGTLMNLSWIQYFVGVPYRSGLGVVPILLFANICLGIYFNLSIWYKLTGKTTFGAVLTLIGAAITLGINIAFIPTFGYMASAWATLACYSSMMVLSWLIGNKHYPVDYDLKRILGYLAVSLALYGVARVLPDMGTVINLAVNNALLLLFIGGVLKFERENIKSLLNRT